MKYNWMSLPLSAAPRDGSALNSYFPMPFAKSARIEILNESDKEMGVLLLHRLRAVCLDKALYEAYGIAGDGRTYTWPISRLVEQGADAALAR